MILRASRKCHLTSKDLASQDFTGRAATGAESAVRERLMGWQLISSVRLIARAVLLIIAIASTNPVAAVESTRLGIKGYDPVSYFTDGRPTKGTPGFSYTWQNVTYYFASAQHRDQFAADPDRYAPQFAGYCAYGVAMGMKAEVDPEAWTIINNKLYLNYDKKSREKWRGNVTANISEAEAKWRVMQ